MKRRAISGLEQDVVYARGRYCYLANRHGEMVRYAKRKMNKRERREGRCAARDAAQDAVRDAAYEAGGDTDSRGR